MKRVILSTVCAVVLFSVPVVFAQNPSADAVPQSAAAAIQPKEEPKSAASQVPVKQTPVPEVKAAEKNAVNKQPKNEAPKSAAGTLPKSDAEISGQLSLIEINDGDFRYKRLSGYVSEKKSVAEAKAVENSTQKMDAPDPDKSKRRASLLVWLTLVSLVVLIVVLYRYGRRKKHRKVFRRMK